MGSLLSKPEAGFHKSFSKVIGKLVKPKHSGQTISDPASSALSPSPDPKLDASGSTSSRPTLAPGNVTLASGTSPPVSPATGSPSALTSNSARGAPAAGVWIMLETSLRALHNGVAVFPPVQSAIRSVIGCIDVMQELSENHNDREELASELTRLSNLMVRHMERSNSLWMSDAVGDAARGIEEQARMIESWTNRGAGRRLAKANIDEELVNICFRRIGSLFRELQMDAFMSVWNVVNEQTMNSRLGRLSPVLLARYDSALSTSVSRRICTANTRTAILSGLDNWSHDPTQADIYWMNGMAGTGKTTIACTFCESLRQHERLAASFFCTRTMPECRAATRILPTIAYQLARFSPQFRLALCESLQEDPDVTTANLARQFDLLLKEPLTRVNEAMPGLLVVVIDALDECDDMRQVELLLRILLKGVKGLPIRFFVTSRPEPEVYNRMMAYDQRSRGVLHLHEVERSLVQADIDLYLREELTPMSPEPTDVQELVRRSGTLFIYAATLVRYIEPNNHLSNPARRLQSVLSVTSASIIQYSAIDTLYTIVLHSALNEDGRDPAEVEEVRCVLHTVICAQEPLSIKSLTVMANLGDDVQALAALQRLRAVIHVSERSGLVSTLHASFSEFMFTETRARTYHCDPTTFSSRLARRCFEVMESQLRFNICNLESSFVRDDAVEDIDAKITANISPVLLYACQYWGVHLGNSNYSESLCSELAIFLSNRLLFWMEVMNLGRKMGIALEILAKAKLWISKNIIPKDVTRYVEDARKFVSSFAANPVSQSTPHIYVSALPFCPKSSSVHERYYNRTKGLISVAGRAFEESETAVAACWTVESPVYCIAGSPNGTEIAYGCRAGAIAIRSVIGGILVADSLEGHSESVLSIRYSPDGSRMVTSSADNTIQVWNTEDGTRAFDPLEGHTEDVVSVAYSPDGTRVVSGSDDHTIRVWDAQSGTPVARPLEGHTAGVWALAYAPDGGRIASGSADTTIRIWNAQNGALIAGPLEGHTKAVKSVAYSPNNAYIASGSYDKTIRVWNATDGTLTAPPLRGHADSVRSVAYSPDGTRIVSGSSDKTIRIWNTRDGSLVAGPLEGHTQGITSVVYSLDGTRIISGSFDSTIRVWDARSGSRVTRRPNSHTGPVRSVAYSPDGTRIVSGSSDHTIRIWHAHNGSLIVGPLEGHTSSVTSVAYSPTGTRVVSASDDCTIRVWSAHNGALAVGPLEGHTDPVRSVRYSPDGSHIVSGSNDYTIRVWNAEDGTLVAGPLTGHTDYVTSVVYSPDGTHIASGSEDETVRVWNAHDGTLDVGPLVGHRDYVNSVAYSPDGTRIASGSGDRTILVWDAQDGIIVAGPFEGHTDYVRSVGYSPDGARIVSGSGDETIRVWNMLDGTLVAGPFNGHIHYILSVSYSPDGTHIVSGSYDQTIRVWSAHDGVSVPSSQVEGDTDPETIGSIASGAWTDSSGWVTASDSRLLLWVPPEVQPLDMLSQLRCQMVIGRAEPLFVEYGGLVLGRRWAECYQP